MKEKYDTIGVGYNLTRKADPYLLERLIHYLQPLKEKKYVDIGCGTGNYTIALYNMGIHITGIDPSQEMLKAARNKNTAIEWVSGKAESIPLEDRSMDGVVATLTIHHWKDLEQGFKETNRILQPGGRIMIFTSTPEQMKGYWVNHYFPNMMQASISQMPSYEKVELCMEQSGFKIITTEKYFVQDDLQDLFLQAGKRRPGLYLDPQVRKGISSFAALSNAVEVEQGLKDLEADILSGKIEEVIEQYNNNEGDYLFIVGEKK